MHSHICPTYVTIQGRMSQLPSKHCITLEYYCVCKYAVTKEQLIQRIGNMGLLGYILLLKSCTGGLFFSVCDLRWSEDVWCIDSWCIPCASNWQRFHPVTGFISSMVHCFILRFWGCESIKKKYSTNLEVLKRRNCRYFVEILHNVVSFEVDSKRVVFSHQQALQATHGIKYTSSHQAFRYHVAMQAAVNPDRSHSFYPQKCHIRFSWLPIRLLLDCCSMILPNESG